MSLWVGETDEIRSIIVFLLWCLDIFLLLFSGNGESAAVAITRSCGYNRSSSL